VIRSHEGVIPS